jgi:predicted nucleotidyltransferase
MDQQEVIDIIRKYINILNQEGIGIDRAFLYGSYATGEVNAESDIDVLLVSNTYNETEDSIVGKTWMLTRKINPRIEPWLIGRDRFLNDIDSPLITMIKARGIEVF